MPPLSNPSPSHSHHFHQRLRVARIRPLEEGDAPSSLRDLLHQSLSFLELVRSEAVLDVLGEIYSGRIIVQDADLTKQVAEDFDGTVFDATIETGAGHEVSSAHRGSSGFGMALAGNERLVSVWKSRIAIGIGFLR
jgi:hypothetical protein